MDVEGNLVAKAITGKGQNFYSLSIKGGIEEAFSCKKVFEETEINEV